jgi:Flp pilus assembly pilin Flp
MISHQFSTSDTSAALDALESSAHLSCAQTRAGVVWQRGQSLVEYVLIILFVALAVVLALSLLAPTINSIFRSIPPAL